VRRLWAFFFARRKPLDPLVWDRPEWASGDRFPHCVLVEAPLWPPRDIYDQDRV
jgi:hypothetical protein